MPKNPDKKQYLAWAEKARGQAEDATTPAARALHLTIAAEYEAKAADAKDTDEAAPETPA
ncbi:MAG: hypothetical protein JWM65_1726 [Sphingomonas bacterium]|nr:hypothetical protein [Sphingomonas bacterium]